MARKWLRKGVLPAALMFVSLCGSVVPGASARETTASAAADQAQGTIAVAQLPREAVNTLNLIAAGGPYPYEKDGIVFGNRERLLTQHKRGYYHEYTVPTPRAHNRGARRIVCGGPLQRTDNCYYSDDHYTSFKRIVE
jgi:ribonuclease T1